MAVVVMWDDGTEARWESAKGWSQSGGRLPYEIHNDKDVVLATIPDFGVRYLATDSPDTFTEPDRSDGMMFGRIQTD